MPLIRPDKRPKRLNPKSAQDLGQESTSDSSKPNVKLHGLTKTASLIPATTNAEAGVYDQHANQGKGAGKTATKEYGVEAVRILSLIAGHERSAYITSADRTFILDMKGKIQYAGSGFVATMAQVHWLRDVKDKLVEKGEV